MHKHNAFLYHNPQEQYCVLHKVCDPCPTAAITYIYMSKNILALLQECIPWNIPCCRSKSNHSFETSYISSPCSALTKGMYCLHVGPEKTTVMYFRDFLANTQGSMHHKPFVKVKLLHNHQFLP